MKYKVLKNFTDKYDNTIKYVENDIVEFTGKRAKEILSVDNLIEKIEEPEKKQK